MYERILVPLDGSELAEGALPYVESVAAKLNSEVTLFTVCGAGDCLERPMRAYLEKKAGELGSLGIKASPLLAEGNVANVILDFAEKNKIGLIIISTHGRSGISRWALGSIANKIMQESRIPILLIRSSKLEAVLAEKELQKILVTLDGSRFAEGVIPYVESLAEGMNSEVILLKVIEPVELPSLARPAAGFKKGKYVKALMSTTERKAKRYLGKIERALSDKDIGVSSALLVGKTTQTILQYAEDNSVSLIALATHGFSGFSKWAYGSVASKIIEGSSKPLLLVRPPLPTTDAK